MAGRRVKLYFMLGLPTETEEDMKEIAHLAEKVARRYYEIPKDQRHGKCQITASSSFFVPKPFTPFQWAPMCKAEEYMRRAHLVNDEFKEQLNRKSLKYNWHDAEVTVLEGIMARGDRKISKAIEEAYRLGCLFDSWTESFHNELWMQAFENTGVDIDFYNLRERGEDELFPWDFIDIGVTRKFLRREWNRAMEGKVTRTAVCSVPDVAQRNLEEVSVMKARIKFRKYGSLRFIGHLDVMRFFQKVMRRADIPIAFSGGYSPHMIMSFANPLGIGLTSDGEYFDIELTEAVNSADAVRRMNEACQIEGIEIVSIRRIAEEKKMTGMTILAGADYLTSVRKGAFPEGWKERFSEFMEQPEIRIVKQTKRSEKEVDIKPLIYAWELRGDSVYLKVAAGSVENLKPDLVMEAFCQFLGIELDSVKFQHHRLEMYTDRSEDGSLIPLEAMGVDMTGDEE